MAVKSQKAELDVPSQLSMYSSSTLIESIIAKIRDLNRKKIRKQKVNLVK